MNSKRIISFICTRNFSKSLKLASRFTRDGLRERLRHQELKELSKNRLNLNNQPAPPLPDARTVRPISDLAKALRFTLFTGASSFTIAIIAEIFTRKEPTNTDVYDMVKKFFVNFEVPQVRIEKMSDGTEVRIEQKSDGTEVRIEKKPDGTKVRIEKKSDGTVIRSVMDSYGSTIRVDTMESFQLTVGQKNVALLIGMNLAVFLMWKTKKFNTFMQRYFTNSYASKSLCAPMLLSTFSHHSFIHFALNMYVTTTFATQIIDKFLGVEQFWAFYLTSAVVSSFVSLADKALVRSPIRALGASGAILALLTYTCLQVPDATLSIIFLPGFTFSAENAVYGIIAIDLLGLLFRFRLFDHAAHLGGSLFGVFYALWGQQYIWDKYGQYIEDNIKPKKE